MRIRQVRPEFWTDPTIGVLPDPVRLFYIGLWNVSDDAGYLDWQPEQIGALLYPYRPAKQRTINIVGMARMLQEAGRISLMDCGCCVIPTLTKHQRVTGTQSFTVRDKHQKTHVAPNGYKVLSRSPVEEGNVEEGNVTSGEATPQEWRDLRGKLRSVS